MTETKDKKKNKVDQVYNYTASKIKYLQSIANTAPGREMLANLRRGVGKFPGELPELWGVLFEFMPEELLGKQSASCSEWAIYTALTLYALHQQGNEKFMHINKVSLGEAAAQFALQEGTEEHIRKRLHLVATSRKIKDLAYYLRSVIQLLSSKSIGLDYAILAKELYQMMYSMEHMEYEEKLSAITRKWGSDFYKNYRTNSENSENVKKGE